MCSLDVHSEGKACAPQWVEIAEEAVPLAARLKKKAVLEHAFMDNEGPSGCLGRRRVRWVKQAPMLGLLESG